MIRNQNMIDRLYLSQGDEDIIYIDHVKIPQNTINGIRFLYKQFKRRRNGVILNDPFSFGRNIQICLFLKAVRPLLHRPVLILCQEENAQDWVARFDTWTDESLVDDVVIETSNPFVKNMVIINTMVNLHLFCGREWSIIVVDGDEVTSPNPILKLPFKACFKIWNTSINMKDSLDRFEEVYKWLFPREIFEKHNYIADYKDPEDVLEKSIMLDSFFEDIVLRRNDLSSSIESHQRTSAKTVPKRTVTTLAVFGPNSSHTVTAEPDTRQPPFRTVGNTTIRPTGACSNVGSYVFGDTTVTPTPVGPSTADCMFNVGDTTITPKLNCIFTVGDTTITPPTVTVAPTPAPVPTVTISKKNKDATGTKIKRSKTRIDSETAIKPSEPAAPIAVLTKLLGESPKCKEDETFDSNVDFSIENYKVKDNEQSGTDSSKAKTDKQIEIIEIDQQPDAPAPTPASKLVEMDTLVFGYDTLISKVDEISAKEHTSLDKKETEPHTILTCKPVGEPSTYNTLLTANSKSTSTVTSQTSTRCSEAERDNKNDRKIIKSKSKVSTDKPEVDIIKINVDELNKEMRELGTTDKPEPLAKRQKTTHSISSETATCEIIRIFNEPDTQTSAASATSTEQTGNSLKRNSIDTKMKECEETVSKKFKGSLLDSLF